MAEARITVGNEELKTVRDTSRELGQMLEALERGEVEKFVITKHGRMLAVLQPLPPPPTQHEETP